MNSYFVEYETLEQIRVYEQKVKYVLGRRQQL